jgi:tRNA(Ile)-lysidine synthase
METSNLSLRVQCFINDNSLFRKEDKLILACSGGLDSVVLATVLSELNYNFSIAHCNFKLRGIESDQDEVFVRELATKLNTEFYSISFNTEELARQFKKGIQETARISRYEWLYKLSEQTKSNYVLTAHHIDDSIETFFINLIRGSGIFGLTGISNNYQIYKRPLLFLKKEEIIHFAERNLISYRSDSSNEKDDYLRNRIRHHLIPLFNSISEKATDGILKSIEHLASDKKIIKFGLNQLAEKCIIKQEGTLHVFDLDILNNEELIDSALFHLLKNYNIKSSQVSQIIASYRSKNSGKYFYTSTHKLSLNRNKLEVEEYNQPEEKREYIINGPSQLSYPFHLNILETNSSLAYQNNINQNIAYINPNSIIWPLKIRHWKEGDFFIPLGMKGEKKLSDFFIDEKVSVNHKRKLWIVENGNKEIIWIPGYRISESVKMNEKTIKMLVFSINE